MPIYKGREFVERVYKGKEPLRRVYKNKELVYGLYDINYHSQTNLYRPQNDITKYAWGKTRYIAPTDSNNDFADYFDQYRTHWYGWFSDPTLSIERQQINNRYIVSKDEKKDLDLYAKWKQKRFSYSYYTPNYNTGDDEEISDQAGAFVAEVNSHIGETASDISSYDGQPWGAHGDWCARYVSACLKAVGYTSKILTTYAPEFFNIANLTPEKFSAQTFVSTGVNALYGNKYPSDFVISESALQPGDIISSFNLYWNDGDGAGSLSNPKGWFSGYDGRKCHGLHVVVCVGHDSSGKALVVGGNEKGGTSVSAVRGPHTINFTSGSSGHSLRDYWVVARPNWIDGGDEPFFPSGGGITTSVDCEDQENPSLPDDIPQGSDGDLPPLPSDATGKSSPLWNELPEDWYAENGGWYWYNKGIPGECVWGANGRSAQMRGNVGAGAPWGDGTKDYSNNSVGDSANTWLYNHKGHWSSTVDWTKVRPGDCLLYGCKKECEADDGSGTIPVTPGIHVVVVEEVLGDGVFKVSTWNANNSDHRFHGTYKEAALPGEKSHYPGKTSGYSGGTVAGYLINHIDPVIGGGWTPDIKYITSEREFDYESNDWGDWTVVDESTENWDFDWEGEF